MIEYEEALEAVLSKSPALQTEAVELLAAGNRVLANSIVADRDYPPFERATMDGFALRAETFRPGIEYRVRGTVLAGRVWKGKIDSDCVEITTGAAVPEGANAVIRVEDSRSDGNGRVHFECHDVKAWQNVARRGEDARGGDLLLEKGQLVDHAVISVLASVGVAQPEVYVRPRVSIISTGDEVIPVDETPGPVEIRNSNAPALLYMLSALGIQGSSVHVRDTPEQLEAAIATMLRTSDVLILTGGVSKGSRDLVGAALEQAGVRKVFHGVRMKPGKPVWFGRHDSEGVFVFGLPGNPYSVQATFRLLVEPLVRSFESLKPRPSLFLPLRGDRNRSSSGRADFFPARVWTGPEGTMIEGMQHNGSGDIRACLASTGLGRHPANRESLSDGELVEYFAW